MMELFQQMQQAGMSPNRFTFLPVLNACASLRAIEKCRYVHEEIIQSGHESDVVVGSSLIDMYTKCGSMEDAHRVFNWMPTRNVISWTSMIQGYVRCGEGKRALELFWQMQQEGVEPNCLTFIRVLNACASVAALDKGRHVHQQIIQSGCYSDIFVANSLVHMYAKCGSIDDAQQVFSRMPARDMVSWTSLILGHVKCGEAEKALELFQQMQRERVKPNPVTSVGVVNACASMLALDMGRHVHEQIIKCGHESNIFMAGSIEDAEKVFNNMPTHDLVSWNAMIMGQGSCGHGLKALELFPQMQQEGMEPNPITFVGLLNACDSVAAL